MCVSCVLTFSYPHLSFFPPLFLPLPQVGYTQLVSNWPAQRTLHMLNDLFSMFDDIAQRCQVEKIETIGDAFMCIVFENRPDNVLDFAIEVIEGLKLFNSQRSSSSASSSSSATSPLEIRSGVCTGRCFGGIVGSDVPRFHVFGEAHDGSILLEQNGRPSTVMVNETTYQQSCQRYQYVRRQDITCGDAGMEVYQLIDRMSEAHMNQARIEMEKSILECMPLSPTSIGSRMVPPNNNENTTQQNRWI